MMMIDGWQIDENKLHGFDPKWRAKWHARDRLFECETSDTACLVYSITEVAMNRLAGRLAIYQRKTNPILVLNPRHFECRFWDTEDPVEYSRTGRILFVRGAPRSGRSAPFCAIDLDTRWFAAISKGEPSSAAAIHEISERIFRLDFVTANGNIEPALIDLDKLEWHDLRKL